MVIYHTKEKVTEGYLLTYSSTDEVHFQIITKDHYNRIVKAMEEETEPKIKALENANEEAFGTDPLISWWTQTYCNEPWPLNNITIHGTVSVCCC